MIISHLLLRWHSKGRSSSPDLHGDVRVRDVSREAAFAVIHAGAARILTATEAEERELCVAGHPEVVQGVAQLLGEPVLKLKEELRRRPSGKMLNICCRNMASRPQMSTRNTTPSGGIPAHGQAAHTHGLPANGDVLALRGRDGIRKAGRMLRGYRPREREERAPHPGSVRARGF